MSNQQSIQIEIHVPAPPAQTYHRISQVRDWWTRDTEGQATELGDEFTVRFRDTFVSFRVVEAEPGQSYVWHVTDCFLHWIEDKTEWKATDLIWDIAADRNGSRITMVHQGITPQRESYSDCKAGWEHFVTASLYKLITAGTGMPEGQGVPA